jgi:radical SAM protein (TIGR01212 family)
MAPAERYTSYAAYLRRRHGERVYRVAVDAGFSCPHRSADRLSGGCTFCGQGGSRAPYLGPAESGPGRPGSPAALRSLRAQIARGTAFLERRYGAHAFILYFQAFSNTLAPSAALRATYDAGLAAGPFRGLVVSTRPDCVDRERAALLASYVSREREVWVELGLQSACGRTLRRIRRGHGAAAFERAFGLLRERGLRVAPHLIFGLPGEGWEEIEATVELVARLGADGVKIHNLHVPFGTPLAGEARAGELPVLSPERHLDYVIRALERLPRSTVVMRLTCDTPPDRLALPRRFVDKAAFRRRLAAEMAARDTWQGRLAGEPRPAAHAAAAPPRL